MVVSVSHLSKYYKTFRKKAGFLGSLESLFKREYEEVKAVNDVSFEIKEGELVGFIGPNGAGKTTTLKCLSGLLYPTNGDVSVLGFKPYQRKKQFLEHISLVMGQKNQLWWDLPAMETFLLNKEIYEISDEQFQKTIHDLGTLLDVSHLFHIPVRKLSLGERMKMELIAALIHNPKVLFLDEPTIGLDVVMQKKLREFIKAINIQYKATIMLTSHYMGDVEALCKRVIVINHGKILFDGLLEDLIKKHAPHKIIKVIFSEYVDPKKISQVGTVKHFNFPELVLTVPTKDVGKVAAKIFKQFLVDDVNIEDPDIEDIIRQLFISESKI